MPSDGRKEGKEEGNKERKERKEGGKEGRNRGWEGKTSHLRIAYGQRYPMPC